MARIKQSLLKRQDGQLRPETVGALAEQGRDIFCWCNRCSHNAVLDSGRLKAELGASFAVPEIGARLRCSRCGSKDVATRPMWESLGQVTRHTPAE